jgi:hypothetical protein
VASFQVESLSVDPFENLFGVKDKELGPLGVKRIKADAKPGYPCRVSLEDAEIGENVLLLKFDHLRAGGFYDASGPIFVREGARQRSFEPDELPPVVTHSRLFSVRLYDASAWMIDAKVVTGAELGEELCTAYANSDVSFVDIHNARPGCFAFRTRRL